MARALRIQFENAYYHMTCRGNARQDIFANDSDRKAFLSSLNRSREIYRIEILAYVLMENHFHLLLKTPMGNLQEFMRHFNISYTSYYNRQYRRSGHLYQGRYKSFLIDADNYLQEVSRYIHLNPVRVRRKSKLSAEEKSDYLREYRWSSYRGYISPRFRMGFLQVDEILGDFGGDRIRGRKGYERFVWDGMGVMGDSPLEIGKGHGIVGEEDFVERMRGLVKSRTGRSREIPALRRITAKVEPKRIVKAVSQVMGVGEERVLGRRARGLGRALAMELLYRYGGMNQREIGELLGLDYSSVSVGRKRLREAMEKDKGLGRLLDKIEALLSQD